jgi:hypothetical protein
MAYSPSLVYRELLARLRGEPLNDFEWEVGVELGKPVIPGWGDSTQLHRELCRSEVTPAFLDRCYGEQREAFRGFLVSLARELMALPDEEEYPPGEEPDPDDQPSEGIELGLGQAFSLLYLQYYRFYLQPDDGLLDDWLKYRRVPHRAKFRRELKQAFARMDGRYRT